MIHSASSPPERVGFHSRLACHKPVIVSFHMWKSVGEVSEITSKFPIVSARYKCIWILCVKMVCRLCFPLFSSQRAKGNVVQEEEEGRRVCDYWALSLKLFWYSRSCLSA